MTNPYVAPSLSGYNANPPPDDGTEVTANQLDWDTHLNKIGNPLKTFTAAMDAAALAAFGLTFGAAVLSKTTAYTVVVADRGRFMQVSGASTITLPVALTAGLGFPIAFVNTGSDVVTIDADGAETINGATTITLFPTDYAVLTCDGVAWTAIGRFVTKGTFVPTFTGFSSDPLLPVINWVRQGNIVTIEFDNVGLGTSDASSFIITNWPAAIRRDSGAAEVLAMSPALVDDNVESWGVWAVGSGASVVIYKEGSAGWVASGLKGFSTNTSFPGTFSYSLRQGT